MYHIFLIQLSADEHLGCFHVLAEIIIPFKLKKTVAKSGMESNDICPKETAKSLINGEAFFV